MSYYIPSFQFTGGIQIAEKKKLVKDASDICLTSNSSYIQTHTSQKMTADFRMDDSVFKFGYYVPIFPPKVCGRKRKLCGKNSSFFFCGSGDGKNPVCFIILKLIT